MLPSKPIHFIGGAVLLLAVLVMLGGNFQIGLALIVLGLGLVFSRFLLKDDGKGRSDAG